MRGSASQRGYGTAYRRTAAAVLAKHRAQYGGWCPGYGVPAHPAEDLTADHVLPKSRGGGDQRENLTPLCRSCNSRKRNR
ncbi:HNH endonuclease signature motif containing protein [Kitasatospora sp. GP82]|uniref:HNH endonuclease n=1 Tax=Kitasatospora sp. GP82 TaxID=3035089 RepID=UPI002474CEFC|nr:HNH endonuclease signature motif containing protein [Kitasatospora sp. GP82]